MEEYDVWSEIRTDYEKARFALWCPKDVGTWHREEDIGRYYLLKAYHRACSAEPKDNLLFARILAMMAEESTFSAHDPARYRKFVKPSLEAYECAIESGQKPTEKELQEIRYVANQLLYKFEHQLAPYEDQIKVIEGYEKLKGFAFHDSKPIWFEHSENDARLKLKYGEVTVTLLFEGVVDFHADGNPKTSYIFDFFCYPCFDVEGLITFDVEYYKITCTKVSVEKVIQDAPER